MLIDPRLKIAGMTVLERLGKPFGDLAAGTSGCPPRKHSSQQRGGYPLVDAAEHEEWGRVKFVPRARVERATTGLGNLCSIHLSYRGKFRNPRNPRISATKTLADPSTKR